MSGSNGFHVGELVKYQWDEEQAKVNILKNKNALGWDPWAGEMNGHVGVIVSEEIRYSHYPSYYVYVGRVGRKVLWVTTSISRVKGK